jgi:nitrogen fixation protein FixH
LDYNATVAAARNAEALGWRGEVVFTSVGDRAGRLVVHLRDGAGRGIGGLAVAAELVRPTHEGHDRVLTLAGLGDGRYGADLEVPLAGQWLVRVRAKGSGNVVRLNERIMVR